MKDNMPHGTGYKKPNEELLQYHLHNAARVLGIDESHIHDVSWMEVGMTNKSFLMSANNKQYVYRIPGTGSDRYISRKQEYDVYAVIKPLAIADEIDFFDPNTGVKISKYYPNSNVVDGRNEPDLKICMGILKKLHGAGLCVPHKFHIEQKLKEFINMCSERNCKFPQDLENTLALLKPPLEIISKTSLPMVLCHIDCANVNFLKCEDNSIKLLDWEYSAMCHGVADIAMFAVFSYYELGELENLLQLYLLRKPTDEEWKLCLSYAAAGSLLWFFWGRYRESFGEDFGDYTQKMYACSREFSKLLE